MLVWSLLLAIVTSAAATVDDDYEYEPWEPINITEFLDTTEKIWTVITTANDSLQCKVDQKESINKSIILFSRKHRTYTTIVSTNLKGTFSGPFPYPNSMDVGLRGEAATSVEELIYQGNGNTCGVFELRNITRVITGPCYYLYGRPCSQYRAFDIRVRGFGGLHSAGECLDWFKEQYPEETFTRHLYEPSCNDIARLRFIHS